MSAFVLRTLADTSIRAVALAAVIGGVLAALRVRSSAVRHAAWTAVAFAMLIMPLLQRAAPPLTVAIPRASIAGADLFDEIATARAALAPSNSAPQPPMVVRSAIAGGANDAVPTSRARWPQPLLFAYAAGVAVMVLRRWTGWRHAARLVADSRPIAWPGDMRFDGADARWRESAAIVAPVTIGVFRPIVLLPIDRSGWPPGALAAVVAHETAHVGRRDPLVNLIVDVNRCLFWFHPLAWWLARGISSAAEYATDAAALRATGNREQYAATLVALARMVRANRGRVAMHAVGMHDGGLLSSRVDRVLHDSLTPCSRRRAIAVAAICASAVVAVAGCTARRANTAGADAAIESRERALRAAIREIASAPNADVMRHVRARETFDVAALEAAVQRDPDDLDALKRLLLAYWTDPPAPAARRRDAILSLIARHPDAPLAGTIEARLFPRRVDSALDADPEGYARAKSAWLTHADRADAPPAVFANAALFVESAEPALAEQLLLRARSRHPDAPWAVRLGRLYALAIAGATAPVSSSHMRILRGPDPQGAFATVARGTLRDTTDPVLLTSAGWFLARAPQLPSFDGNVHDWADWAATCLERAIVLEPTAIVAHTTLLRVRSQQEFARTPLWQVAPAAQYQTVSALPEQERFAQLARRARDARSAIEWLSTLHDPNLRARYDLARADARRYANDALRLAPRHRDDPQYGTAIYVANITLGALALDEGRTDEAVAYLRKAARAPESEELRYADDIVTGLHWHLAADLLKRGERAAVADFADRMAEMNLARRDELRDAAAAIRRGETPAMFR